MAASAALVAMAVTVDGGCGSTRMSTRNHDSWETVGFCIMHCLFWWVFFVGCFGERLGANVLWDQKYSSNNAK